MQSLKILILCLSLSQLCFLQCVHDQFIKNTTIHYYNDLAEGRLLQTSSTGPLRIFMDYTQVITGGVTEKNYIKRIMNITANYFYNLLTVQRLSRLYFPSNTSLQCNVLTISSTYVTQGTIGDIGVVVGNENVTTPYVAKSTPCAFLTSNKRPIWGMVMWNINSLKYSTQGFQQMMFIGLHQMTHVLAFSALMFQTYYPNGNILGNNSGNYYLTSTNIKNEVKNYFGCNNANGLDVQDQDGTLISSHWQKHHVGNQFMISSNKKNTYISRLTLAVFNSTGWYPSVNFSLAEPMTWGKNKGCNFLNVDDCDFDEFCTGNGFECDWDGTGEARCDIDIFSGSCSVPKYYTNTICIDQNYELLNINSGLLADERGGYNSRCHASDFRTSGLAANILNLRCYITVCSATGQYIYILVNGYTLICTSPGLVIPAIPGFDGTLTCPSNFGQYCSGKKTCAYNCNSNGACINGQCLCTGAIVFTSTCILQNFTYDTPLTTGGRILFIQNQNEKSSQNNEKRSLRREYNMQNECSQGYIFDPILKKCLTCIELLGCQKCNEKGCLSSINQF